MIESEKVGSEKIMETLSELKARTKFKDAEIPVVIGVTGHRDIDKKYLPEIREQVRRGIETVRRLCPHSPIVMLSALAQGGDQLCAEVALSLGVKLKVVLPFDESEFLNENDFDAESLENYKKLRAAACDTYIAPDIERRGLTDREYRFRCQSVYVATNCHVLFALCDGEQANGRGCGANAAVDFALGHSFYEPDGMEFGSAYDGAVLRVFCPRAGKTYAHMPEIKGKFLVSDKFSVIDGRRVYTEHDGVPKSLRDVLVRTDVFNADYIKYLKSLKKSGGSERAEYLIGEKEYELAGARDRAVHDCHNVASALSSAYKKKYMRGALTLAVLGVLLILFFMLYDQLGYYWTAAVCFVMLFVLIAGYFTVNLRDSTGLITKIKLKWQSFDVHARFVEYRALSETLRAQYYVSGYGLDDNVCAYFTWGQKTGMAWVKKAVAALNAGSGEPVWEKDGYKEICGSNGDPRATFERAMFLKWVGEDAQRAVKCGNGQLGYHLANVKIQKKRIKKRNIINTVALLLTVITYFALFLCELVFPEKMQTTLFLEVTPSVIGKSVLSVFTAATFILTYYYGKMSLDRSCADSLDMIGLYTVALDRLDEINAEIGDEALRRAALASLVRSLAREQLIENGTWVAYSRDNGLDLPI